MERQIVLVRHGQPRADLSAPISGQEIGQWVRRYDDVGITRGLAPPIALRELAASAGCIISSDLPRARESAVWLAASKNVRVDPDLREAPLPESLGMPLKLPPNAWVAVARAAWWLNWGETDETLAMTRQRAGRMADRLIALALEHGSVMAVGHGMFNRFLGSQLRARGWRGPKLLRHGYWATEQFRATR